MTPLLRSLVLVVVALLVSCGDDILQPSGLVVSPGDAAIEIDETLQASASYTVGAGETTADDTVWESTAPDIATIAEAGGTVTILGVSAGTTTIIARASGFTTTFKITVRPARLVGIRLDTSAPSIPIGTTKRIAVAGTFSDDSVADVTAQVTWAVDKPNLLSMAQDGTATPLAAGEAFVTATLEGFSSSTRVFVTNAQLVQIAITPINSTQPLGLPVQFSAIGRFTDNSIADITQTVTWASQTTAVATISNTAGSKGRATTLTTGDATITATQASVTGTQVLHVSDAVLASIAVTPALPLIPLGIDPPFAATGTLTDGTPVALTTGVTWSSTVTAVATIDPATGIAETEATGLTTIRATVGAISGSTVMAVTDATLDSIAITPATPSVPLGVDPQFTATATFSDGSQLDITDQVLWSSTDEDVATIANLAPNDGRATTLATGTTTIRAELGSVSDTTVLTVTAAVIARIDVTPATPTVAAGLAQQFVATAVFTDDTQQAVTTQAVWESSDETKAQISNADGSRGLATTLVPGTTTIAATFDGVTGSTLLTVGPAALVSIDIASSSHPGPGDIPLTADVQFTATGNFTDGSSSDLTSTVTWASTNTTVATIDGTGIADAKAAGTTNITATSGAITDSLAITVSLAPVTGFAAVAGYATAGPGSGFGGVPCVDGVKFSMASDFLYVCSTTGGAIRASVDASLNITFLASTGVTDTNGLAIAAHTFSGLPMMYMSRPAAGVSNWFRSGNNGSTFTAHDVDDSGASRAFLYAGRFQQMVGNMLGTWDPGGGAPKATVLIGNNTTLTARTVATATGTVRSIGGFGAATNLWLAVLGEMPDGSPATGGVFQSVDSGVTWTDKSGSMGADKDRVRSIANDLTSSAKIIWAGIDGGGRVYKTEDADALAPTWTVASGVQTDVTRRIPPKAKVNQVFISPQSATTVFAATDIGLWKTTDGGATWTLAGFQGRAIRGVGQSGANGALLVVGVDDAVGLYRAE